MHFMRKGIAGKGLALVMVAVLTAAGLPAMSAKEPKAKEKAAGSTIEGDIVAVGGKEPASAVLVTAIHLESSKSFVAASDRSGHFRFTGIPHGYYELAFAAGDRLHVGSVPVVVGPAARLKINVTLLDKPPYTETGEPVLIPVLGQPANAVAEVHGRYEKPWYRTKTGVATIIGASVAGLLILTR